MCRCGAGFGGASGRCCAGCDGSLEQIDTWEKEETAKSAQQFFELDDCIDEIAAKLRRLDGLHVDGEIDRAEYAARKKPLLNEKIALEARRETLILTGLGYWLEPLRGVINAVRERNLPTAGVDPNELRDFVAKVGSNLSLNSRKVLWDWIPTYAPLSRRASFQEWWSLLEALRTCLED